MYRYTSLLCFILCSAIVRATPADSCGKVPGMHVTGITMSTAHVKWNTAASNAVGYQYVINHQPVPPDKYGLFTKDTVYKAKGLAAGATYYAHVRSACQNSQTSDWATVQFNTPAPPRPDEGSDKVFAVVVYPAQTDRSVTIKAKGILLDTASVRLFDMRGMVIKNYTLIGDRLNIEVNNLPPSIYYIRYLDDHGRMQFLRFTRMQVQRQGLL